MSPPLKLEALYYFLVAANTGNFSSAADQLFVTQQALSKSLAQLERKLGTPLFERVGRVQMLTPAGRALQAQAAELLKRTRLLEQQFQGRLPLPGRQTLRIGYYQVFDDRLYVLLKQALRRHPGLAIQLRQVNDVEAFEAMLLDRELDLGLSLAPSRSPQVNCKLLQRLEFVIVGAREAPVQAWDELGYIRYSSARGDDFPDRVRWPEAQFPRRIVAEADYDTGLALCEMGYGAMYVFKEGVQYELANQRLKVIASPPFVHELAVYALWRTSDPDTDLLWELLQELLRIPAS